MSKTSRKRKPFKLKGKIGIRMNEYELVMNTFKLEMDRSYQLPATMCWQTVPEQKAGAKPVQLLKGCLKSFPIVAGYRG